MNALQRSYALGRGLAMLTYKTAAGSLSVTSPVVKGSTVLGGSPTSPTIGTDASARLQAPTDPVSLKKVFDVHEQGRTRLEPAKKVAGDDPLCTTCRKSRHYGPCLQTKRTKPTGEPLKAANFNAGMLGEEPPADNDNGDGPLMSAHYHSATTADSALARARDGRPAIEQANTEFSRLPDLNKLPDQAVNLTNGLNKTAYGLNPHVPSEQRGPNGDPYDMLRTPIAPPIASGAIGTDAIDHAFGQIDCAVDSTNLENGASPAGGPAALG